MINTVDKYSEYIYVRFDEVGDSWGAITKLPHYKTWTKVLNYLRKRGFEIKTPERHIKDNYGIHTHKVAKKGDVVFCLECMGSQIKVEWGDIKNLWDTECNFWSLTDRRSVQLTYLESKKIELEVNKLLSIFPQDKINLQDSTKLSPEERILKNKKESSHNRDKSKLDELGLDGIVYQMSEYDHNQNSTDKHKKKINCGELKYFYDYDKRLKCGRVYHQLNNRWYVLSSDDLDYVSDWELFDYNGEPRRKQLKTEEKMEHYSYKQEEYYIQEKVEMKCKKK